jgi:hypothetical protein
MATNKVEIGFDFSEQAGAEFAKLDDAFYGILDAPQTILGGAIYQDVTPFVVQYSLSRGKSRQLDRYQAGKVDVTLDNNTRVFDPLFASSPYAGQIIPKRSVRVTSNDVIQSETVIDDWDLSYEPSGNSYALIKSSDAFAQFANQSLSGGTATAQQTGERVTAILQNSGVQWPLDRINAETGQQALQADVIDEGTNALGYLNQIAESEPGELFVSKTGDVTFLDRHSSTAGTPIVFADDGSGIPYQSLAVVYGAELLYNEVVVTRVNGGTATATNAVSQNQYGIQNLTRSNLPLDNDTSAQNLADYLVAQFAQPEYRFEAIEIEIIDLAEATQTSILDLELGDFVRVKFTPNNLPPQIDRYAEVIRISQRVTETSHKVTLGLGSTDGEFWRLSDLVFGRLGNALAY